MFHVKRCFRQKNNLAVRNHLRLFEPEAFTSTLSGKRFQKDTEHSVFHVKHASARNDMVKQYALTLFNETDAAVTAKRRCLASRETHKN